MTIEFAAVREQAATMTFDYDANKTDTLESVFADLPATWAEWPTGDEGKALARSIVRRHREAMDALRANAEANGGRIGGALALLAKSGIVSDADLQRLSELLEYMEFESKNDSDAGAAAQRLREIIATIHEDDASSPTAVAMATIAGDSVAQSTMLFSKTSAFAAGVADTLGWALGSSAGPLGAMSGSYSASDAVYHAM